MSADFQNWSSRCKGLVFDELLHAYTLDGVKLPSVTQVLSVLNDFSFVDPDVLARKARLGTAVHKAVELYLDDDLDMDSLHDEVLPYFQAFLKFEKEAAFKTSFSECRLVSKSFKYAGTCDLIGRINEKKSYSLIDIKCVASLSCSVGPQLAAYKESFNEMSDDIKVKDRYALQLKPDGTYRLVPYKDMMDFEVFKSCLNIHKWKSK